jgi:uncharacterized protein (DUF305 family)
MSSPVDEVATAPVEHDDAPPRSSEPPRGRSALPWRLPWARTVALILTLCFVAGIVGWYIGRPSDPSYNSVDVGFLADMTDHHSGAINLAFKYLERGQDPTLTSMAREIIVDQSQEVGNMNGLLAHASDTSTVGDGIAMDWMGHPVPSARMPGLATKADYDRLAQATPSEADDQFSRLMIRHHEAGVEMADYAARNGENDAVRALARAMAKAQRFEIGEMNLRRVALGLPAVHPSHLIHTHG